MDLCQYVCNGRGRGNTNDNSLMTLTTSGKLFSFVSWSHGSLVVHDVISIRLGIGWFMVPMSLYYWRAPSPIAKARSRVLSPKEMLCSQVVPVTAGQAKRARAPRVKIDGLTPAHMTRMAGNAMNVPTIGLVLLAAVVCLEKL